MSWNSVLSQGTAALGVPPANIGRTARVYAASSVAAQCQKQRPSIPPIDRRTDTHVPRSGRQQEHEDALLWIGEVLQKGSALFRLGASCGAMAQQNRACVYVRVSVYMCVCVCVCVCDLYF